MLNNLLKRLSPLGNSGSRYWEQLWNSLFKARPEFALDYYVADPATTYLDLPSETANSKSIHGYIIDFLVEYGLSNWNGYRYWMAHTPTQEAAHENPNIIVSNDRITWVEPVGISNPIEPAPGGSLYNADVFLYYDKTINVLYCLFTQSNLAIWEKHSTDGVNWSDKVSVYTKTGVQDTVSANLVKTSNKLYLYATNGTSGGMHRKETTGVTGTYSAPENLVFNTVGTSFDEINGRWSNALYIWHQETRYLHGRFFALLYYRDGGSVNHDLLWLTESSDGINFNLAKYPVIRKPFDRTVTSSIDDFVWDMSFYKSSFIPYIESGILKFKLWYIGSKDYGSVAYSYYCGYSDILPNDCGLNFDATENTIKTTYSAEIAKAVALNGYVFGDDCNRANEDLNVSACGIAYTIVSPGHFHILNNYIINAKGAVPANDRSSFRITVPVNYELSLQMINGTSRATNVEDSPNIQFKTNGTSFIFMSEGFQHTKRISTYDGTTLRRVGYFSKTWKKDELVTYRIIFNGINLKIYCNGMLYFNHDFIVTEFTSQAVMDATLAYTLIQFDFPASSDDKIKNIMIKQL